MNPLIYVCNIIISTGMYPDRLKMSKSKPLRKKKGEKNQPASCRPIALISGFSKIIETVILDKLKIFFARYEVIEDVQFGYKEKTGTIDAIVTLLDKITIARMENLKTAVIFLDLSKAFDCVSHDQLLDILSRYGVRGKPLDLFESYLRNRLQCVEVAYMKDGEMQNIRSDLKIVSDNVPQGSVMGPFLFNVYTNGLKKVIHDLGGQAIVYVDDTNIVITAKTQKELTELSMRILNGVYNYFASLKLALNVDKTVYMLFNNTEECT